MTSLGLVQHGRVHTVLLIVIVVIAPCIMHFKSFQRCLDYNRCRSCSGNYAFKPVDLHSLLGKAGGGHSLQKSAGNACSHHPARGCGVPRNMAETKGWFNTG